MKNERTRGIIALLLFGALATNTAVAVPPTGTGVKSTLENHSQRLSELETANDSLQSEIDILRAMVQQLHRFSAAVLPFSSGGSDINPTTSMTYTLSMCDASNAISCPPGSPDLEATVTGADQGTIVTFTSLNDNDFDAIATLLTDGVNERVSILVLTQGGGGGGTFGLESGTFRDFLGAGAIDFSGLQLGSISLAFDQVVFSTTPNASGLFNRTLNGRAFFELAN